MTTDRTAYNKYTDFPNYSYKIIKHLMNNNELVWQLLKYTTPDASDLAPLSPSEKQALIWKGEGDTSDFGVFLDDGQPDVTTKEIARLNIMPYGISPDNRSVDTITILMEVYSHYKINTLSNYTTRVDTIIQQLLEVFNGEILENVGAIGRLHFDKAGTSATRVEVSGQLPFKGKWLLFANKSAV